MARFPREADDLAPSSTPIVEQSMNSVPFFAASNRLSSPCWPNPDCIAKRRHFSEFAEFHSITGKAVIISEHPAAETVRICFGCA
jgi:hypothetical protein